MSTCINPANISESLQKLVVISIFIGKDFIQIEQSKMKEEIKVKLLHSEISIGKILLTCDGYVVLDKSQKL